MIFNEKIIEYASQNYGDSMSKKMQTGLLKSLIYSADDSYANTTEIIDNEAIAAHNY